MKTSLWSSFFLTGFLIMLCAMAQAQSGFKYKANLTRVDTSGFYRITLPPKIVGKCQNSLLTDLRIIDDKGRAVPYVSQKDAPVQYKGRFIEFETLPPNTDSTAIMVKVPSLMPIEQMYLLIKNNNVQREVNISGSDDGKKWYIIDENSPLSGAQNNGKGYFEYPLMFPTSTYQYYSISVSGRKKGLIKILKAGYYKNDQLEGNYDELPAPVITQLDSAKTSYVKINFDDSYIPDKLHIAVSGGKYYRRGVAFSTYQKPTDNHVSSHEWEIGTIMSDTLDSKKDGNFYPGITSNALLLEIDNEDNPPLKVTSAQAYQLRESVLCYLEAGKNYHLTFGDLLANAPQYDLAFFTDSINAAHTSVKVGPIIYLQDLTKTPAKPALNFTYLMWSSIIVILLALGFFTYKIANEVKAKNS